MLRFYALLLVLLAVPFFAQAQSGAGFGFEYRPAAQVVQGADTLQNAWTGAYNTPQFSTIDLDGDGQNDLFAFDRETNRCYTFLSVAAPGTPAGRRWRYAPDYEQLFPNDLENWVLLRDYDCDGRPDLFCSVGTTGNVRVFRNVAVNGRPSFQLATGQVRFSYGGATTANLLTGGYNTPAIQDINGDGKLDIMTYDFYSATSIELYLNTSPGPCGSALTFDRATSNWGGVKSCVSGACAQYSFDNQATCVVARPLHTGGHSLLLLDLDGDGDQDLLDGRDNCPELVRLLNQGTTAAPVVTITGISSNFPAATPVRVPVFPGAYSFDANFDGRPDLVVAPNMLSNISDHVGLRNPVQVYENTAASGAPAFAFRAGGFAATSGLDLSEGAAPTFGDIDGDGLPDMLVGNRADRVNNVYRATLTYFRNVGTRTRPVFREVNSDYLGLAARLLQGLKPVLVDLNRDGALDLVYGAMVGSGSNVLYYILNTAAAGQPVAFDAANAVNIKGQGPETATPPATYLPTTGILPYAEQDMPCFADVDNDGFVDLLIGTNEIREPGMALRYFRNKGQGPLDSAFVLVNNDFGHIREATGIRPYNLSPTVGDFDGDGKPDLVTADITGLLRFYSDYRAQGSIFAERTNLLYSALSGQYEPARLGTNTYAHFGLAQADLNGDGAPELFVGMQSGGILSYGTRNRGTATATRAAAAHALALSVFPNPATATATVETATPTQITVLDLAGRVVRQAPAQRRHTLSLTGLAPGVYLVRAQTPDGTAAVQRLQVQ